MKITTVRGLVLASVVLISTVSNSSMILADGIEPGKTARLNSGDYIGGEDIPAGSYVLYCKTGESDHGIVWLSSENDDLEEDYPSLIYSNVSSDENKSLYVSLHEGGILHVPFQCSLTAVDYFSGEISELHTGTYVGGKDLPADRYLVSYETDNDSHGIIWLADAEDNLDEDYPSMIYENIGTNESGTYFISLMEGRKLYLPVSCTSVSRLEEIRFENDQAELFAGQYVVGEDIPAGSYDIDCKPDEFQDGGILWVSTASDNLGEEYPSVLYEYVNKEEAFHVTLEDGGRINLPFRCEFTRTTGGVVFQ